MASPCYRELIDIANRCADDCTNCSVACVQEAHVIALRECILIDLDCAEICRTLVLYLARGSKFSRDMIQLALRISDQCAEECEKHKDMEHCARCAATCREFSKAAKNFANA
jgi:hypothetical protein